MHSVPSNKTSKLSGTSPEELNESLICPHRHAFTLCFMMGSPIWKHL